MAEKRLNIPVQMIQAGSRNRRSLLSLRQNEGALYNCLHECGEALGAPLSIAAVGVQRRGDIQFEHGDVFAEASLAGSSSAPRLCLPPISYSMGMGQGSLKELIPHLPPPVPP